MPSFPLSVALASCALMLYFVLGQVARKNSRLPRPPGPAGYPFIGNILDADWFLDWQSAADIRRQWGDVTSISVPGQTIVTLHTYEKTVEFLEKNSLINSSRPALHAPGMEEHVVILPYGADLHECRRMLRRAINPKSISNFHAQQMYATRRLLRALAVKPEHFFSLLSWYTGTIILKLVYGYDTEEEDDFMVDIAREMLEYGVYAISPENPLTKFPWLRYLPSWVPGSHFKKTIREGILSYQRMRDIPFEMALNNNKPSFVSRWFETASSGRKLKLLKESSLVFFSAGTETTETSLSLFFFRMQEMPHIQEQAQAELDRVIGRSRLPTFEDRQRLPYVNALCKEILRHDPPLRKGIPHHSTADYIHDGYFIPKGTTIFPSIWEMSRDVTRYKNPDKFDPSRFLGSSPELDPASYIFGFGRRICSGMLLADSTFFIAVASLLATFNISPPSDGSNAKLRFNPGLVSHPKPFNCVVKPREGVNVAELAHM